MENNFPPGKLASSEHGQLQVNTDNLRKSIFFKKKISKHIPTPPNIFINIY